jgi:hypothetical protein
MRTLIRPLIRPRNRRSQNQPLPARVDYRVGPFIRGNATICSPSGAFDERLVWAEDAEGIYLAVLTALDALRRETGRPVEPEHILHEDLVPA